MRFAQLERGSLWIGEFRIHWGKPVNGGHRFAFTIGWRDWRRAWHFGRA